MYVASSYPILISNIPLITNTNTNYVVACSTYILNLCTYAIVYFEWNDMFININGSTFFVPTLYPIPIPL